MAGERPHDVAKLYEKNSELKESDGSDLSFSQEDI